MLVVEKEFNFNMKYFDELKKAMKILADHPKTLFLGQAVVYDGTAMTKTLAEVPSHKKIEMPVCEDLQMGISNGLALNGIIPVSIFPRWDFLLLATNQIVNHLDKFPIFSGYKTKVIIRTGIGSQRPLHPQCQHIGDYSEAFQIMCKNIDIITLVEPEDVVPSYLRALNRQDGKSTILVEYGDFYNEK